VNRYVFKKGPGTHAEEIMAERWWGETQEEADAFSKRTNIKNLSIVLCPISNKPQLMQDGAKSYAGANIGDYIVRRTDGTLLVFPPKLFEKSFRIDLRHRNINQDGGL